MNIVDLVIETILEWQRQNKMLTDLEKDILSTWNKCNERPFDRMGTEQKITENNIKYPDIFVTISNIPGIEIKPFSQAKDEEVMDNLKKQIEVMCGKEYEINFNNMYRSNYF